jgi:hypothetical protein
MAGARGADALRGRRFANSLGTAFLVLAAVAWLRGRFLTAEACGVAGGILLVTGWIAPARLRPVERAWMRLALAISRVTMPVLIAAVYFVAIMPTGLLMRVLGRNPLARRQQDTLWVSRGDARRSDLRRQF